MSFWNWRRDPDRRSAFDQAVPWIMVLFAWVFVITGVTSGYATIAGIFLIFQETGGVGSTVKGSAIMITVAVTSIVICGWTLLVRYGPDVRASWRKLVMLKLGAVLLAITLCVSSLPNLVFIAGPAAKQHDWRLTQVTFTVLVNAIEARALGVLKIRAGWLAEMERACQLEQAELTGGVVSTVGSGTGPVAVALSGVCTQTKSFVGSMDQALQTTEAEIAKARAALGWMRDIIRDRDGGIVEREDQFLLAGDRLITALQKVRAADLSDALDAGAAQVGASVAELGSNSAFSPQQVEMVSSIKAGLQGLVSGTKTVSDRLRADPLPEIMPIQSPDFIGAIMAHVTRYVPLLAAAVAIDCFMIWALAFLLAGRGEKPLDEEE
ncbi:MAG: hypothetical protein AAGC81_18695 [Pseudomonadota bacterium]